MAISVLDVRDTLVPPRVPAPARAVVAATDATAPRRLPLAVASAGLIVYFGYGRRNSRFSTPGGREDAAAANAARRA